MSDVVYPKTSWPYYSVDNVRRAGEKKDNTLGKDDFLKLMIAQMQNQDPTSPMDNKDLAAQTAQFTSVEQLAKISDQLTGMGQSLGNSSNLIGKQVVWNGETKTGNYDIKTKQAEVIIEKETGIVDSIVVRKGVHYVKIGSKELELSKIVEVEAAKTAVEDNDKEVAGTDESTEGKTS
jgi:flagellar basal-body rod modification protein FlgD